LKPSLATLAFAIMAQSIASFAMAADFNFYGRSGDAIEINFTAIPGVSAGATFSGLNTSGFSGHTVLTSDTLTGQTFASSGRLWVFANPARDTVAEGDANPAARGYEGSLSGSLLINGVTKTFSVLVQPGYTGGGQGSVGQSLESLGDSTNNPLYVAQQQQRLRYFNFVRQGGAAVSVTGTFDNATDEATRTFQGAFLGGVNTTQADADGIIGPITAGWLNAANAPTWNELIDPDPQLPGTFSTSTMIGNFDIYPGPDPGTGARTGNTPQPERFGTSWTVDLIKKGSALAKATTGRTQRINAISMSDGYGSSCCHNTHRVGMDIDLYTNSATWNLGNGTIDSEEQKVISHAISFVNAGATGRVIRFITSNQDIYDGIHAASPNTPLYYDTSGDHQNHLHIDVGPPTQVSGLANLSGDFNLDDVVDDRDYLVWRRGLNKTLTQADYTQWRSNFGKTITNRPVAAGADYSPGFAGNMPVPEPLMMFLALLSLGLTTLAPREFCHGGRRTHARHMA
jgi:hypothetical protein